MLQLKIGTARVGPTRATLMPNTTGPDRHVRSNGYICECLQAGAGNVQTTWIMDMLVRNREGGRERDRERHRERRTERERQMEGDRVRERG